MSLKMDHLDPHLFEPPPHLFAALPQPHPYGRRCSFARASTSFKDSSSLVTRTDCSSSGHCARMLPGGPKRLIADSEDHALLFLTLFSQVANLECRVHTAEVLSACTIRDVFSDFGRRCFLRPPHSVFCSSQVAL